MAGAKSKGLGRGLESLFGDTEEFLRKPGQDGDAVQLIDINDIKPNSSQPRQTINEEKIDELATSITAHGIIQPILLKKSENGYEIAAGERRWRAARKAGLKQIPGLVRELTPEQLIMIALIENIQRENLNPIEEAEAFYRMSGEFKLTQEDISRSVGKSRPYITNSLRLLKLPEPIKRMVLEEKLSNGHARALINMDNAEKQKTIAEKIILGNLSVRETEKLVKEADERKEKRPKKNNGKDSDVLEIEKELKEILGTKVTLKHSGKRGKLEIEYFSREELERLIEIFRTLP